MFDRYKLRIIRQYNDRMACNHANDVLMACSHAIVADLTILPQTNRRFR